MKNAFIRWIKRHRLSTPIFPIVFLAAVGVYGYLNDFEFPIINQMVNFLRLNNRRLEVGGFPDRGLKVQQYRQASRPVLRLDVKPI